MLLVMHSFNPTATPFNLASIKFGISPSECECDDCKNHWLKSIVFGQMPNDYVCTSCSSESLVDNLEPADNYMGENVTKVYRYPRHIKSARSMSAPTLSTIPEEDEDVSTSDEENSCESSCEESSAGTSEPSSESHCPDGFAYEVPSWSPTKHYPNPFCDAQASREFFYTPFSEPFVPYGTYDDCRMPTLTFCECEEFTHAQFDDMQDVQYYQSEEFTHAQFDDMQDIQYCQPENFTHAHFEDMPQPQYYQSEFTLPRFYESSMPDHYFGTPFTPYYKFDYAQYNSHIAQNQYPFPIQGPAQFILDHSMLGEKSMDVNSDVSMGENVPVEYVGYSVDEGEDWVYVDRDMGS